MRCREILESGASASPGARARPTRPRSARPHRATGEHRSVVRVHVARLPTRFAVASASDVPEPVKSVLDASVAALKPAEVSLDAFNSQYLQRHASSAAAILASAKVSHVLDAPRDEVENLLFTTLADGVQLGLEVRSLLTCCPIR
jgi:hypothetical protein